MDKPVILTGATGYIGGRLAKRLLDSGRAVRCLARDPAKLECRDWAADPRVEIVRADLGDPRSLAEACRGGGPAYYLVHSMIVAGRDYHARDVELARNFVRAADEAGLDRIIYLGGLGETGDGLSEHLASRREVERVLAEGAAPLTVLRAAMIIGSGSASFEILRYLVERLPAMITPRWVGTECQPIAVRDALGYLTACLDAPETKGLTLDIGGPDVLPYRELLQMMAEELGLRRRLIVPVPVLTPRLSSYWIHLVTPVGHRIAQPLARGLKNRVVCRDDRAAELMPMPLLGAREAIAAALGKSGEGDVETSWLDAGVMPGDPDWAGGTVYEDRRERPVAASSDKVWDAVCRVGGRHGWYAADLLWRLRGVLDRLVGGPGLRRGRRHARRLEYGDALDFWRVTGLERGRRLVLRAEMKLPGEAELEFSVVPDPADPDRSTLAQIARFRPRGLAGLLYWFAVTPFHGPVFNGMVDGIRKHAENA